MPQRHTSELVRNRVKCCIAGTDKNNNCKLIYTLKPQSESEREWKQETRQARASKVFPGASEKNSEQVAASKILNSPCLLVFERIGLVTSRFTLFCVVSVSLFSIINTHCLHEAQDADLGELSAYVRIVTLVVR